MRTLVLVVLCITVFLLIIAAGLDPNDCSMIYGREMLKRNCGYFHRRKRGFGYSQKFRKLKHHKNSVIDQKDDFEVVANDTTGGILVRHKRNSSLLYCCMSLKNCSYNFTC